MHFVSRICFNRNGWTRSDGSANGLESGTFYAEHGYGHEEWLFRFEWQIDGWQYGFLQGVNNSRARFQVGELCDVTLFSLEPEGRRFVATIQDLECLTPTQSQDAFEVFQTRGWFARMQADVEAVEGIASVGLVPQEWLNVRFRSANVQWFPQGSYASADDYVHNLKRYQMNTYPKNVLVPVPMPDRVWRKGREDALNQARYWRSGTAGRECTPEHARMQKVLLDALKHEFPLARVVCEENFVDVLVETSEERILYEIKSDLRARTVIRLAIGQLLEYGFHRTFTDGRSLRLVIVGRSEPDPEDAAYLDGLCNRFGLPLAYRVLSLS